MVYRVTEKDARRCAERLAKTLGKRFGDCWEKVDGKTRAIVGCWDLDCNPYYGGCVIEEITSESGARSNPLGMKRWSPRDFCELVFVIERIVDIVKQEEMKKRWSSKDFSKLVSTIERAIDIIRQEEIKKVV